MQKTAYELRISDWSSDVCSSDLEVTIDGLALRGRIADAYPQGIARVRFDPPAGRSAIRNGLDWLLARAAGQSTPLVEVNDGDELGGGPNVRAPLDRAQAREGLRMLHALRAHGLQLGSESCRGRVWKDVWNSGVAVAR